MKLPVEIIVLAVVPVHVGMAVLERLHYRDT